MSGNREVIQLKDVKLEAIFQDSSDIEISQSSSEIIDSCSEPEQENEVQDVTVVQNVQLGLT